MGTGCGLNNNSCSGTFKFKLQPGKEKKDITTDFLGLLLRNTRESFIRGHSLENVTIHDNIISIEFEFNLENDKDPKGEDGLYVGPDGLTNNFNETISSIIDFGGIPLVKYGLTNTEEKKLGAQFAYYTGDIVHSANPPLIRANTTLSQAFRMGTGIWDIRGWKTSGVNDMSGMFEFAPEFNKNIGGWNTSNVTDMSRMFYGLPSFKTASPFNKKIGGWDTSNVTDMSRMFQNASEFDQNIGGWDTSKVTDMADMFNGASDFDQDLSGWCVEIIKEAPTRFSENSGLVGGNFPVWSTCPTTS